jgi:hypothetical protein
LWRRASWRRGEGETEVTDRQSREDAGLVWRPIIRLDNDETTLGVLEPDDKWAGFTPEEARDRLWKAILSFRLFDMKVLCPILVPVDAGTVPHENLRLPAMGDFGFLVPDPAALSQEVREALVEVFYDVPWCVPYGRALADLPEEERQMIRMVRIAPEDRTTREAVGEIVTFIGNGGWVPIAWGVRSDEEADALRELGVNLGEGLVAPRSAAEAFPWGEVDDNPFA